jgi:hypothetical protein
MRLLVTFLCVLVVALATMTAHVGVTTAKEGMAGTSMVTEMKMDMGVADPTDCPSEMCAKMKECAAAPAPVTPLAPITSEVSFAPRSELIRLALHSSAEPDSGPPDGIHRPPRLI